MTMVRQDDTPARRRYRHERLAVLALLALGSNLGCGREILRVPAGAGAFPPSVAPPVPSVAAIEAMEKRPPGPPPVAIRVDYGSTLDELFPSTYRNPGSYGPQMASRSGARPEEAGGSAPDSLLAACANTRIPLPSATPLASHTVDLPFHEPISTMG